MGGGRRKAVILPDFPIRDRPHLSTQTSPGNGWVCKPVLSAIAPRECETLHAAQLPGLESASVRPRPQGRNVACGSAAQSQQVRRFAVQPPWQTHHPGDTPRGSGVRYRVGQSSHLQAVSCGAWNLASLSNYKMGKFHKGLEQGLSNLTTQGKPRACMEGALSPVPATVT